MDGGVAISAPGKKGALEVVIRHGWMMAVQMSGVTLHTKEGLGYGQQRVVGRSVRVMTVGAIFRQIGVFVDERPLNFHMTPGAHFLDRRTLEVEILRCSVGIMAVVAGHFALGDRMVRKLGELHANLRVTPVAEFVHLLPTYLLLRTAVQLVTVKTTDFAIGVSTCAPIVEVGSGRGRMALQAD